MCSFRIGDWEVSLSKDSKPRELMIELTTECNLNCIHCFRNSMRESFGRMTRDIMERILSEIEITGVKAVSLSGWGEPSCHPDFLWFIKELKTRGVKVLLNTNGTLLSKFAVTISAKIDYFKPVYVEEELSARAKIENIEDNKSENTDPADDVVHRRFFFQAIRLCKISR